MKRRNRHQRPDASFPAASLSEAPAPTGGRKPRLLIAGEFSAGKTRLISGLMGEAVLPSNLTATALPPVWLVAGAPAMAAVDDTGALKPIETLDEVTMENTRYCVISHTADILKRVEIIDTPGSSDPNIPTESWEKMLSYADTALWCTNATQAWRQSEKSVWSELPEHLVGPATLLVTHADRMADDIMASRVMRRVRREADGYFSHYLMASLISPDDVARVSAHIVNTIIGETEPVGEEAPKVAAFARKQAKAEAEMPRVVPTATAVRPARVLSKESDADAAPAPGSAAPDQAEIVALELRPRPAAPAAGPRALWQELSGEIDLTDPDAILGAVDSLLSRMETAPDGAFADTTPADRTDDIPVGLSAIAASANGRKA